MQSGKEKKRYKKTQRAQSVYVHYIKKQNENF